MQVIAEQEDLSQADLQTIMNLLQRHDEFVRSLSAVEKQVNDLSREAGRLESQFPDTKDHLEVRRQEMEEQLKDVLSAAKQRQQKLTQAEQLQAYFQEYRDFLAWIQQMQTTVTSESLPRDVTGCEALMQRHLEYHAEIKARQPQLDEFVRAGNEMIGKGHLLASEIQDKVEKLQRSYGYLCEVWQERKSLYDENLDAQIWKRDASLLEVWMSEREGSLGDDWRQCDSVEGVEDMIRHFDDFLTTLDAQSDKFEALKKLTLLEQAFTNQRTKEQQREKHEEQRRDKQRKDQIKTVEKHKILQERRQERERRKTQEISLFRPAATDDATPKIKRQDSEPGLYSKKEEKQITPSTSKEHIPVVVPSTVSPSQTAEPPLVAAKKSVGSTSPSSGREPLAPFMVPPTKTPVAVDSRKTPRRTPTFTTRRAHSLKKVRQWDDLSQVETSGYLDRKQELQSGGKKATIRSWKNYYTILCGQLLCFFKDEEAFMENTAASSPIYIMNGHCEPSPDYQKRKHSFRLRTQDGAEYLFSAPNEVKMHDWVAKVAFHAALPPSLQLKSFDDKDSTELPQLPSSGPPLSPAGPNDPGTPRRHTLTGPEVSLATNGDEPRRPSTEDSGFLSPTETGMRQLPSVSDQGPSTDDSRNGSSLVIEHEDSFDMNDSTNGRPLSRTSNKGPSASPTKSSTLPPNATPSTPPPFIESRSGSLKPQPPPRAQKSGGDFVAWSERGQSSSPDRQDSSDTSMEQKRGSKKIFGGLFKGKKHRESKDLSK